SKANPSKDDKLFLLLADKPDRTPVENRTLAALLRVERAKETMRAGRGTIRQATSAKAKEERRERDHQRFLAAGLMTMVGLLDGQTGKPTWDRATLVGALDAMARVDASEDQKGRWKARGDALLAKPGDHTQTPSDTA
ncbi:conjugal transfer protein TraD, partial [Sphingomonas sp. PAMC 26605]|uniref:conjugal transfer protein TraD n=1 Tax=Sphingomonas sp. PAMC 26605 TaxID=1112214 RepID=UPI00026CDE75